MQHDKLVKALAYLWFQWNAIDVVRLEQLRVRQQLVVKIAGLARNHMPNSGPFKTNIDILKWAREKLVFFVEFNHPDNTVTQHWVTVTPSFVHGVNIKVSGKDQNGCKMAIVEACNEALNQVVWCGA